MRSSATPRSLLLLAVAVLLTALLPAACVQKSPEEQIEDLRAQYTVTLNSFSVIDQPVDDTLAGVGDEGAVATEAEVASQAGDDAEATEEELEEAAMASMPTTTDVVLDILVATEAADTLPGVTVELEQVDAAGNLKDSRRLWIETSELMRGPGTQVTHEITGVDYQEGDGFTVSVRSPVPAEERSEYREFEAAETGPGS